MKNELNFDQVFIKPIVQTLKNIISKYPVVVY